MTGLIWIIQLIHYPSFLYIDKEKSSKFTILHQIRISYIVAPMMLIEFFTAGYLVYVSEPVSFMTFNLLGVIAIWLSTFLLSVPLHLKISEKFDSELVKRLIHTNWPRTILWTARSLMLILVAH
jgi:hypothetical protein